MVAIDNFVTGVGGQHRPSGGNRDFKFIQQDVTEFLFLDGQSITCGTLLRPASPIDYLELPIQTLKVGSLGTHKALGLAKEKGRPVFDGLHLRNLRRPAGSSASARIIGGTSTQSGRGVVTMNPSGSPSRSSWRITGNMAAVRTGTKPT